MSTETLSQRERMVIYIVGLAVKGLIEKRKDPKCSKRIDDAFTPILNELRRTHCPRISMTEMYDMYSAVIDETDNIIKTCDFVKLKWREN